jgi:hypothetical protein
MSAITIVAILGLASTFTMFAALVRQTIRAERAERRLEIVYAVARASGRDDIADTVGQ